MSIILRDYQDTLVAGARREVACGHKAIVLQLPTGGGKTPIAATILKRATDRGARAHFMVHRKELAKQALLEFDRAGIECGFVAAGFPMKPSAPVQICSIQTLSRRLNSVEAPDLIIVDECHHAVSESYSRILAHYNKAVVIGITATVCRLDGSGLNKWFTSLVCGPQTKELIDAGWLSPYRIFSPSRVDLSHVKTLAGDFDKRQLADAMKDSTVSGDALTHYQRHVPGKRALIFMWSIESSIAIAERFNAAGIRAAHVDGTTPDIERERIIREFSNGTIRVLSNVDLVSEGFNVCGIEALLLCRPTQSLGLYLQQIGRGLRPMEGKEECIIFDHWGGVNRFGFPDDERTWDLSGVKKRKKSESDGPLCRICPNCFETHPLHVRICPCGYQLVMEREVEVDADAQLVEIDPAVARRQRLMEQGKADSLEKLIQLGKSKGYKYPDQWARFIFKARKEKKAAKERQLREREHLSPKQAEFYAGFSDLGALEAPDPWAF